MDEVGEIHRLVVELMRGDEVTERLPEPGMKLTVQESPGGMHSEYDQIIAGSESAGSVLAARLQKILTGRAGADYPAREPMPDGSC